jgi:protein gp37
MGTNSNIEWCTHTWNPWLGCTKVGPPCDNCYAEAMMDTRYGRVRWGAGQDRVRTSEGNWKLPFKWDRAAAVAGKPATVFCLSLGDIWDNEVDPIWRRDAFAVMEGTPHLTYLLLSKRIGNAVKMCDPSSGNRMLPSNAALGATMASQPEWDRDIGKLKEAGLILGGRFTFASVEPMLGRIEARGDLPNWVIVGGESGRDARPMHDDWVRSLRDQCVAAGVPFHFKQWGAWAPEVDGSSRFPTGRRIVRPDGTDRRDGHQDATDALMWSVGKKAAGRLLDGVEWNQMPT